MGQIEFTAGRRQVELHFAACSYRDLDRVRFRHRLDGFNTDWIDAGGERVVYYSELRPGNYQIHVIAENGHGVILSGTSPMPQVFSKLLKLFTVAYDPNPTDKPPFLDRSQQQSRDGLKVTVAVMSDRESQHYFGVRLARKGSQPVWIDCVNDSDRPYRLDFLSVDTSYYTPLEAAHVCHFSVGKRLLSFGGLAWIFLPLLPLIPLKIIGARRANRRIDALFKKESFRFGPIPPKTRRSGVVFTTLDEGNKNIEMEFVAQDHVCKFDYSPVSSLYSNGNVQDLALQKERASINERIHLRLWTTDLSLEQQPVWIGQVSRDIGVRFTPKTWNLTTHRLDSDMDEARDYVIDYLLTARRLSQFGYVPGVEAASESAPRHNLTGDPYFTDGNQAVLVLSRTSAAAAYLEWS